MSEPTPEELASVAVLIPALEPGDALVSLLAALRASGLRCLLVVDDGSGPTFDAFFDHLQSTGILVLRHPRNLGKGRALRTGFSWILQNAPNIRSVITADADGQHTAAAILALASHNQITLGSRAFTGEVPLRSRLGNALTRRLFAMLTGHRLQDTQSGLRGFPRELLPELLLLPGDRYEYETAVLLHLCRIGRPPREIPIETLYLAGNRSSHFRPLRDSLRVLRLLLLRR